MIPYGETRWGYCDGDEVTKRKKFKRTLKKRARRAARLEIDDELEDDNMEFDLLPPAIRIDR